MSQEKRKIKNLLEARSVTENMNLAVSLIPSHSLVHSFSHSFIHSFKCLLFGSTFLGAAGHNKSSSYEDMATSVIKPHSNLHHGYQ